MTGGHPDGQVVEGRPQRRRGQHLDLGPEAGENGGTIIAEGTPEQVAKSKKSRTAPFLKEALSRK